MIEKWNLNMEERKIWITLGGSILFSFLLAVLVILFDTRLLVGVEYLPNWTLTNVHLAREILGLLAGSLLTAQRLRSVRCCRSSRFIHRISVPGPRKISCSTVRR
ncbi:MAG: hypothetical protein U5K84_11225 [Alkalibacterium sp.]|nr:hypothetical protein [Alkalibacterium sp.]